MIEAVLWIAIGCAVCGALVGNRSAWALLASAAVCLALDAAGIQFHFFFWMLIDFAVVAVIVRQTMTYGDCVILALFIPAWGSYLLPDPERYYGSVGVTCLQLLLTFPVGWTRAKIKQLRNPGDTPSDFDLRVVHAAGAW